MFSTLRTMIKAVNRPSEAEVEGLALLARIDGETRAMHETIRAADRTVDTTVLAVARARLTALKEAAIAARALRPEHIRYSGALACLQCGQGMAPMMGQAAAQIWARVA